MKVDGGCHCVYIKYEAEIDPEKVSICHCTDCQTGSGSAYRTNVQGIIEMPVPVLWNVAVGS